jgi:hypothetical protein
MRVNLLICAALVAAMTPAVALADDPNDPTMHDPAARARDHEQTRQLNAGEIAMVRERDARYAEGWRAYRGAGNTLAANDEYAARWQDQDRAVANYARDHAQYEQEMAAWRRSVAACRSGDYSACGN